MKAFITGNNTWLVSVLVRNSRTLPSPLTFIIMADPIGSRQGSGADDWTVVTKRKHRKNVMSHFAVKKVYDPSMKRKVSRSSMHIENCSNAILQKAKELVHIAAHERSSHAQSVLGSLDKEPGLGVQAGSLLACDAGGVHVAVVAPTMHESDVSVGMLSKELYHSAIVNKEGSLVQEVQSSDNIVFCNAAVHAHDVHVSENEFVEMGEFVTNADVGNQTDLDDDTGQCHVAMSVQGDQDTFGSGNPKVIQKIRSVTFYNSGLVSLDCSVLAIDSQISSSVISDDHTGFEAANMLDPSSTA